ncbi:iron chelate uptake ABC transporter family permease subunit [Blastococcus tunisiensis]|uniref:iron chelate uptake ABC transporter family permease subunit n=1 Tax=Blastococcus tunisiensis TaxID=1798228 RepID=UPI003AA96CCE
MGSDRRQADGVGGATNSQFQLLWGQSPGRALAAGITGGATLGALAVLIALPSIPVVRVPAVAFGGALPPAQVVYALVWGEGSSPGAMVPVCVAISAFAAARPTQSSSPRRSARPRSWAGARRSTRTWASGGRGARGCDAVWAEGVHATSALLGSPYLTGDGAAVMDAGTDTRPRFGRGMASDAGGGGSHRRLHRGARGCREVRLAFARPVACTRDL